MALRKSHLLDPLREVVAREHPRDRAGLLTQLVAGDAEQRRWAARDLPEHADVATALGTQLLREPDPSVREALFTGLGRLADAGAARALLPLLRSEDATLRNGAIETLAGMPEATGPCVDALLEDSDVDVRIFAVNLLADLRHPQVPAWLLQVLVHEPDVNVVAAAIEVLLEVGTCEHLAALRDVRERFAAHEFIAFAVDLAVERIEAS